MEELKKQIEEILVDKKSLNDSLCCTWEQINQLLSLFTSHMLEIIGKDEGDWFIVGDTQSKKSVKKLWSATDEEYIRNDLRAELRAKVKEIGYD